LKEEIGEMRDEEMATERWENEGGHTLTKYAIARFVRAFQSRLETGPLGEVSVPAVALCGVQMMLYVAYALLESLEALTNATRSFEEKCMRGIRANRERCRMYAERTVGLAALHNQELGFMGAAKLAQRAIASGKSVREALGETDKPDKGSKYGSAN
jgi:fumarate hydratase class II